MLAPSGCAADRPAGSLRCGLGLRSRTDPARHRRASAGILNPNHIGRWRPIPVTHRPHCRRAGDRQAAVSSSLSTAATIARPALLEVPWAQGSWTPRRRIVSSAARRAPALVLDGMPAWSRQGRHHPGLLAAVVTAVRGGTGRAVRAACEGRGERVYRASTPSQTPERRRTGRLRRQDHVGRPAARPLPASHRGPRLRRLLVHEGEAPTAGSPPSCRDRGRLSLPEFLASHIRRILTERRSC